MHSFCRIIFSVHTTAQQTLTASVHCIRNVNNVRLLGLLHRLLSELGEYLEWMALGLLIVHTQILFFKHNALCPIYNQYILNSIHSFVSLHSANVDELYFRSVLQNHTLDYELHSHAFYRAIFCTHKWLKHVGRRGDDMWQV